MSGMNSHETPSISLSLHEQLIYKLAALDASMQSGFRRLDEKMDRFQSDLHDSQLETNDRINKLDSSTTAQFLLKKTRLDRVDTRLNEIEIWQKIMMARATVAVVAITLMWAIFGPSVKDWVGKIFN